MVAKLLMVASDRLASDLWAGKAALVSSDPLDTYPGAWRVASSPFAAYPGVWRPALGASNLVPLGLVPLEVGLVPLEVGLVPLSLAYLLLLALLGCVLIVAS